MRAFFFNLITILGMHVVYAQQSFPLETKTIDTPGLSVVVINETQQSSSFKSNFNVVPLMGSDATSGKNSLQLEELLFFFDSSGNHNVKLSGNLNLNCCFGMIARVDLIDESDRVIFSSTTRDNGDFGLTSNYGRIASLQKGKVKLNFSRIDLFDMMGNTHTYVLRSSPSLVSRSIRR